MKKIALLTGAVAVTLGVNAQDRSTPAHFIQTRDSLPIYNVMQENAPGLAHVKDVPRFTLIGKDSKFYLGIGANVKAVADYDWGSPISNANEFTTYDITGATKGNEGLYQMSAAQSNFYLNMVALPGTANQLGIYIDINFMRPDHAPMMHHAYLKYRGFTAGHTISIFTDLGADPAAIDYEGPNAITYVGHPNVSYTGKFGKDKLWSAAIAIDMPETSITGYDGYTSKINQRVPDIPFFIQRGWCGGNGWFRVSGILRNLYYRDLTADNGKGKNVDKFGWGVKVSGKTPICGGLSAMWQAVYGKGVSSYIQDLTGNGYDLMPTGYDALSSLKTVKAWAGYGTLRYDFCPKVFINATYSHVRTYVPKFGRRMTGGPADISVWDGSYKWAQYITGNLFWNINSFTQFGVEYLYGRRMDYSGIQHHDNRLMMMLQVSI